MKIITILVLCALLCGCHKDCATQKEHDELTGLILKMAHTDSLIIDRMLRLKNIQEEQIQLEKAFARKLQELEKYKSLGE
jgi:hypothetical protein